MKLSIRQLILFSFVTGVLLSVAWPANGFAPLLFVAWVPLLLVEEYFFSAYNTVKRIKLFWLAYLAFFTFNLFTTWWIVYASIFGACMALVFNSLFMAIAFYLAHILRTKIPAAIGFLPLVALWVTYEYLHMNWDLTWSWLNMGNGFAGWYKIIQWYEYTGALGGSVWVIVVNVLVARALLNFLAGNKKASINKLMTLMTLVLLPVVFSLVRYYTYTEKENPVHISIIQPNIDPYNEKFSGMSSDDQIKRILSLADSITDNQTDFVIAPETALPDGIWENNLTEHPHFLMLKEFMKDKPKVQWVIGLASNYYYDDSTKKSVTARKFLDAPGYYDSYNTALFIGRDGKIQLHHKSKLVPGVERLPFPSLFQYFENFAIDLGGTSGSLGTQKIPTVFNGEPNVSVAPVICYESVYGEYVTKYVNQGASLIFIITNDGWWKKSPGYRQHLKYASLRAIELRRSIARSANTGISAFVNQRGDILQETAWWVPAAIKGTINSNHTMTFYARTGDVIGKLALWISGLIILFAIVKSRMKR
jgi:apolipoprotein N-acyltransferase